MDKKRHPNYYEAERLCELGKGMDALLPGIGLMVNAATPTTRILTKRTRSTGISSASAGSRATTRFAAIKSQ